MEKHYQQKGFGLVEVVVAAAIFTVTLVGLVFAFQNSLKLSRETGEKTQAAFLLEESIEVVRMFRNEDWNNIALLNTGIPYYLQFNNGEWATSTEESFVDGTFKRTVTIENVYRDGNDDIADSGTLDDGSRKITATVSWRRGVGTTTATTSTYIMDIF